MRKLRAVVVLLFVLSLAAFGGITLVQRMQARSSGPTITGADTPLELQVAQGSEGLLAGLSAEDAEDGDLSDQILIASTSYFTDQEEKGRFTVDYVVFDSDNNFAQFSREVVYTDYISPRIYLSEPLGCTVGGKLNSLPLVTAEDCLDGDITNRIKISESSVSTGNVGIYPVPLEVTNAYGDVREVTVQAVVRAASIAPTVTLNQYILYLQQGDSFRAEDQIGELADSYGKALRHNAGGLLVYDSEGEYVSTIQVDGVVDTNTPGNYLVAYTLEDNVGTTTVCLTVVVE